MPFHPPTHAEKPCVNLYVHACKKTPVLWKRLPEDSFYKAEQQQPLCLNAVGVNTHTGKYSQAHHLTLRAMFQTCENNCPVTSLSQRVPVVQPSTPSSNGQCKGCSGKACMTPQREGTVCRWRKIRIQTEDKTDQGRVIMVKPALWPLMSVTDWLHQSAEEHVAFPHGLFQNELVKRDRQKEFILFGHSQAAVLPTLHSVICWLDHNIRVWFFISLNYLKRPSILLSCVWRPQSQWLTKSLVASEWTESFNLLAGLWFFLCSKQNITYRDEG